MNARIARSSRLLFAALVLTTLSGVTSQAPASASCAELPAEALLAQPVVFLGTAAQERQGYERFAVEESWRGPRLATNVWVQTGQDQPPWPMSMLAGVGSSGDATFSTGRRYVIAASADFRTLPASSPQPTTQQRPEDCVRRTHSSRRQTAGPVPTLRSTPSCSTAGPFSYSPAV